MANPEGCSALRPELHHRRLALRLRLGPIDRRPDHLDRVGLGSRVSRILLFSSKLSAVAERARGYYVDVDR